MRMAFKDWLKKHRLNAGLTQKALAAMLQVPSTMINKYENSNTEPRISFVVEVAEILCAPMDELKDSIYTDVEYIANMLLPYYEIGMNKEGGYIKVKTTREIYSPFLEKKLTVIKSGTLIKLSENELALLGNAVDEKLREIDNNKFIKLFDDFMRMKLEKKYNGDIIS